ncbi:MAG: NADH-quinone oxidoreductase subunit C [Anaerolineales bacterium]|nr:NADH-quinone oxidoreductase subunit C [Anaerolineales bacterium]
MSHIERTIVALRERFGEAISGVAEFRGETTVTVSSDAIVEVLHFLKESPELGFTFLADLTAYDDLPREPRFYVVYQLRNLERLTNLRVKCALPGDDPRLPSVTGVHRNANWPERELFDMFGIQIEGHPDLRRILMPADWVGHPLRKDYPLGYEEVQFTFNFDEIDRKKPYAKE